MYEDRVPDLGPGHPRGLPLAGRQAITEEDSCSPQCCASVRRSNDFRFYCTAHDTDPERELPGERSGPRSLPCSRNAWLGGRWALSAWALDDSEALDRLNVKGIVGDPQDTAPRHSL